MLRLCFRGRNNAPVECPGGTTAAGEQAAEPLALQEYGIKAILSGSNGPAKMGGWFPQGDQNRFEDLKGPENSASAGMAGLVAGETRRRARR